MTGVLAPVVVGRAEELAFLRSTLDDAADGRGVAVLLVGEAGIGKTRLLREVRRLAGERGAAVMVGRAADTATAVPFRPIAEALMAAYRSAGGGLDDDPDVAPFRDTLARLVPGLGAPSGGSAPPVLHVAEGFLRVARCRGRGRVAVVLLDDLHWADEETLAVVEYLADNVGDEPVLVVAATRSDADGQVPSTLRGMVDRRAVRVLALPRFSVEQVTAMTRSCLGDAAVPAGVLRLLHDRADGLPFFVEELLAGLVHDGVLVREGGQWVACGTERGRAPGTFADSVRRRFGGLPPAAGEILLDAALVGRWIDPDLLARVSGTGPDDVDAALDAGVGQGLLETAAQGVRFRHALTRDALLAGLAPHDRRERSRRALAALRTARPDLADDLIEIAADLSEAAGDRGTAVLLLEVGRRAAAQGALATAEGAQRRALAAAVGTPAEIDAREALVVTLGLAGRADEAFPLGEVLLAQLGDQAVDPDGARRCAVHLALARAAVAATDWPLATAHLALARRTGGSGPVEAVRIQTLEAVVAIGEFRVDPDRLAADAVRAAERTGDPDLLCEALLVHGRCARIRDLDEAIVVLRRAREVARTAGLAHREARALTELGVAEAVPAGEDGTLQEARRLAEASGAPETEAVAQNALSVATWVRADGAAMRAHAEAALLLAQRYRLGTLVAAAWGLRASERALHGDRDAMEEFLALTEPLGNADPIQSIAVHAQCRGACALARDELDVAGAELALAAEIVLARRPTVTPTLLGLAVLLPVLGGADPPPLTRHLRSGGFDCGPLVRALLDVADAVVLGRRGDPTGAGELARRGLRVLAPSPWLRAVTARLVAPVAAVDGWGEPVRWLSDALEVFTDRGLLAPAQACRTQLRRLEPGGDLTAREREVLDLIAEGLPNKAVAVRLFLSPRTVEKHVERLLAKTGSANRAQLATYAVRRAMDT